MARKPSFPRRGSVCLVDLDPTVGHELKKTRPAVVVSNDHMNELAETILVMPITAGKHRYLHWVPLDPPDGGVSKPSAIVTEQVRAIDKRRLQRRLGAVRPETMEKIEQAIRDNFALPEGNILSD
ncbi:MAG TPA: type II toxin-antitoxin system PemK/MazF family toxin [Pirellulales bacterium]